MCEYGRLHSRDGTADALWLEEVEELADQLTPRRGDSQSSQSQQ